MLNIWSLKAIQIKISIWKNYTEWKEFFSEGYIMYDFIYITFLNEIIEMENQSVIDRGERKSGVGRKVDTAVKGHCKGS